MSGEDVATSGQLRRCNIIWLIWTPSWLTGWAECVQQTSKGLSAQRFFIVSFAEKERRCVEH